MDGITLRKYREAADMSLKVVAAEAQSTKWYLHAVESGKYPLCRKFELRIVQAIQRVHNRREVAVSSLVQASQT